MRAAFDERLAAERDSIEGDFSARHAVLHVPKDLSRFWTPCLELTLEEITLPENLAGSPRSKLWGTFSPRPEIWTAFVFSIGTLVAISICSTIYGCVQLMLRQAPSALAVPVCAAFLAMLLYVSALVGQGLSITEMYRLRAFVDDCIRDAETKASPHISQANQI